MRGLSYTLISVVVLHPIDVTKIVNSPHFKNLKTTTFYIKMKIAAHSLNVLSAQIHDLVKLSLSKL